jgi:hypothetical protein
MGSAEGYAVCKSQVKYCAIDSPRISMQMSCEVPVEEKHRGCMSCQVPVGEKYCAWMSSEVPLWD